MPCWGCPQRVPLRSFINRPLACSWHRLSKKPFTNLMKKELFHSANSAEGWQSAATAPQFILFSQTRPHRGLENCDKIYQAIKKSLGVHLAPPFPPHLKAVHSGEEHVGMGHRNWIFLSVQSVIWHTAQVGCFWILLIWFLSKFKFSGFLHHIGSKRKKKEMWSCFEIWEKIPMQIILDIHDRCSSLHCPLSPLHLHFHSQK